LSWVPNPCLNKSLEIDYVSYLVFQERKPGSEKFLEELKPYFIVFPLPYMKEFPPGRAMTMTHQGQCVKTYNILQCTPSTKII
jgi:hypothetical protein